MNLGQFLSKDNIARVYSNKGLLCFYGKTEYPLLFFSNFFAQLKRLYSGMVATIDLTTEDPVAVRARLEMSFLGMHYFYWLKNLSELNEQTKQTWLTYLATYSGPHGVAFFVQDADELAPIKKRGTVVEFPEFVDVSLFLQLSIFFTGETPKKGSSIIDLVKKNKISSLDTACLLLDCGRLVGNQKDSFTDHWLSSIIVPEKSLFTLSQYFFAKNPKEFFLQWSLVMHDYSEVFWISFWSDQVWRAYCFALLNRNKQFAEAKKMGFRLPFSFIQREWKHYSLDELHRAHQWVYDLDFTIKNGGDPFSLDLFYSKFLMRKFA